MNKLEILKTASKSLDSVRFHSILSLFNDLGLSHISTINYPLGGIIYRLRPSEPKPFSSYKEIGCKDSTDNFGRAHWPKNPAFYGSFAIKDENQNPIITNLEEYNHILAKDKVDLKEKPIEVTIGKWKVINSFKVVPMIFHMPYLKKNNIFSPLYESFKNLKNSNNWEIIKFIAQEFAKMDIKTEDDYKISAAFTNFIYSRFKGTIEAIIYPSVRSDGNGLNIALSKNCAANLKLIDVACFKTQVINNNYVYKVINEMESIDKKGTYKLKPYTYPNNINELMN